MDLNKSLGSVLKELRENKGLSMDQVQLQHGFAKINLSKWENARVQISLASLKSYSEKVFGLQAWEVLKMAEENLKK